MKATHRFALGSLLPRGGLLDHFSPLLMEGRSIGAICGDELLHQFRCDAGYLLIVSYDKRRARVVSKW